LAIEKFCNNVASEILFPATELKNFADINKGLSFEDVEKKIDDFVRSKNISCSMVAYKLYLNGNISLTTWNKLKEDYYKLWIFSKNEKKKKFAKNKEKGGGPNYITLRNYSLSRHLISFVDQLTSSGDISTSKASRVLGVSPNNMQKLTELGTAFTLGTG
jgi:Zn-dependent peptidase ImmA (M78 family)